MTQSPVGSHFIWARLENVRTENLHTSRTLDIQASGLLTSPSLVDIESGDIETHVCMVQVDWSTSGSEET